VENERLHDDIETATVTNVSSVTDVPGESVAVDDLLEDVSIDGMCGVY
jgi:mycofactocin precursor